VIETQNLVLRDNLSDKQEKLHSKFTAGDIQLWRIAVI